MASVITRARVFNEQLALKATRAFGSMWTTYAFMAYGFLPLLWPWLMNKLLYWSNTVQLWSLPLLMVGGNLEGRAAERRAEEQFRMIQELVAGLHEELALLRAEGAELRGMHAELHETVKRVLGARP